MISIQSSKGNLDWSSWTFTFFTDSYTSFFEQISVITVKYVYNNLGNISIKISFPIQVIFEVLIICDFFLYSLYLYLGKLHKVFLSLRYLRCEILSTMEYSLVFFIKANCREEVINIYRYRKLNTKTFFFEFLLHKFRNVLPRGN